MCSDVSGPPVLAETKEVDPHDLEWIVTAVDLVFAMASGDDATFTFEELLREANAVAPGVSMFEADLRIVLPTYRRVERRPGGRYGWRRGA